jgi:hypothetical protein
MRTRAHRPMGRAVGLPQGEPPRGRGLELTPGTGAKFPGPSRHARRRCLLIRCWDATPSRHPRCRMTGRRSDGRPQAALRVLAC